MERIRIKKQKTVSAILTSDWHLREDTPICRTDDFQKAQWGKVNFIRSLQERYKCDVIHAGDLFHHWKPSPYLLSQTISHLPDRFHTVLGQHDLPQHSLELVEKCGVQTLQVSGKIHLLSGCHWGQTPEGYLSWHNRKLLVWHHLTYIVKPFPGASAGMAEGILRKYPQYDLIVTGDNHESFVVEYEGRLLVNPGCLTRQTADQIDFQPRVYLWYAEDNTVEPVYLPITKNAISREHIERKEQHDKRIEAFVRHLNNEWQAEVSFEANLEIFFQENNTNEAIKEIIYKALEV